MLFTTPQPITQSMAIAITHAVREIDSGAIVRADVAGQQILIDGKLSAEQALAALVSARCESAVLEQVAKPVHIQGGHTCCGHCV